MGNEEEASWGERRWGRDEMGGGGGEWFGD
jgi:hypothetical protein